MSFPTSIYGWCPFVPTVASSILLLLMQNLETENGGNVETAVK
jgi:hypothetical protein